MFLNTTKTNFRFFFLTMLVLLIGVLGASSIWAYGGPGGYTPPPPERPIEVKDYNSQNIDVRLSAYKADLLGDSVDLDTGALSFRHVDVDIPGNSHLPVRFARYVDSNRDRLAHFGRGNYGPNNSSGWSVEIPYITGRSKSNNAWSHRCSVLGYQGGTHADALPNGGYTRVGVKLFTPGQGARPILKLSTAETAHFGTQWGTKDNWKVNCTNDSTGGYFTVTAPTGDIYTFKKFYTFDSRTVAYNRTVLTSVESHVAYPTEIKDINGNWVRYEYSNSTATGPTRIHSNDGRSISINYSGGRVSTVVTNSRTWSYQYSSNRLYRVILPDGKYWEMDGLKGLTYAGSALNNSILGYSYACYFGKDAYMKHPDGVIGHFKTQKIVNFRNAVPVTNTGGPSSKRAACNPWTYQEYSQFPYSGGTTIVHHPFNDAFGNFFSSAVTEKKLSLPTGENYTWSYSYEDGDKYIEVPETTFYYGHAPSPGSAPSDFNKKKRTLIEPSGAKIETWYSIVAATEGELLSRDVYASASASTPLRKETFQHAYVAVDGVPVIPDNNGSHLVTPNVAQVLPTKVVTTQHGDTFTREHEYDRYGHATRTKSFSNVSATPRDTVTTYSHNISKWILGLPTSVKVNNRLTVNNVFDSLGRKTQEKHYGYNHATFGYNSNGTLAWYKDANNRQTQLLSWKRGTPQRVLRPDGKNEYQYVDNNGWLTSTKDALSRTTAYTRDNMGRITLINPHGSWANTSIGYNFTGGGAVQTITKANSKSVVTYDAMFRPIREETRDLTTGISTYVNNRYDALGRTVFTSQPSTNANETKGVDTTYDALGRVTKSRENVSPYAETRYNYYSSHRKRVTDPSGKWTDYYSYGYDGPGNDSYRAIYDYANGAYQRYTYLYKNVWGELTSVRQWGGLNGYSVNQYHYYYYNSKRQVCRYREKEGGDTVYQYDNAGWLKAYQTGLSNGSACSTPTGTAKVTLTRDALNRVTKTDYADIYTPDVTTTYDAVGNVLTKNRSGANWTYAYNTLNLPTAETLRVDGRAYGLTYGYNLAGQLTSRKLPSGRTYTFNPDGLGRAREAKYGSTRYASNITYHPSGSVKGMNYANGYVFSQTLNSRLLPSRIRSTRGSTKAVDSIYSYDSRGLITSITDSVVSGNNRSMTYDPLGQLLTASGPWGSGAFKYDSLGNIREKTLGSRKVTLSYDSGNRVSRSTDTGGWGGNTGTRTLAYDSRGNVRTLGGLTFTYDYANQPRAVSGSTSGTYKYDGNYKRVKSTTAGETIYNVFDVSGGLVHIDNVTAGEKTDYINAGGQTIARIVNSTVTYLHTDHLGSPVAGSNASGTIQWREKFSPFGITDSNPVANVDQMGFTGHIQDSATGLNYMQARYYDPVIGRFLSTDPVGFVEKNTASFNRYLYVNNNPYMYVDPDGEYLHLFVKAVQAGHKLHKVHKARKQAAKGYSASIQLGIAKQAKNIMYQDPGHSGSDNHEIAGGLTGAILNEALTGESTKGTYHGKKGETVLKQLNKLAKRVNKKGSPLSRKQKRNLMKQIDALRKPLKKALDTYKKSPLVPNDKK